MVKTTIGRRGLSLFLTLVMCLTMAPAVFADDSTPSMTLTPSGPQTLDVGGTVLLTASFTGIEGSVDANQIAWSTSDPAVATVNGGTVTAVAPGTATITASYTIPAETPDPSPAPGPDDSASNPDPAARAGEQTVTAVCEIIVTDNLTEIRLTLDKTELELTERGTAQLNAALTAVPAGASITAARVRYTWESSNSAIASVPDNNSSSAVITARGEGVATIRVNASYTTLDNRTLTASASCRVGVSPRMDGIQITPSGPFVLDVNREQEVKASPVTSSGTSNSSKIEWKSDDTAIVSVGSTDADGHSAIIRGRAPGITKVTASTGSGDNLATETINVTVSGIVLENTSLSVQENELVPLPVIHRYGAAANGSLSYQSANNNIAAVSGTSVAGRGPGTTTITVYVGANYQVSFTVTVSADPETTIGPINNFKVSDTLSFGEYLGSFRSQANGGLSHLTGLRVDPAQGTLYYRYNTADGPEGVSQTASYYDGAIGSQKDLSQITFVPKSDYTGSEITINYTVVSNTYQNTNGRIILKMDKSQASNELYLSGTHKYPAQFSGEDFNRICQQNYGAALNYVTFSLPSSSQGTLYTDYVSEEDYGSKVTTGTQYRRQDLDKVFFVPNEGFSGTVTIYYTARAVGTPGATYSGQVIVKASRDSETSGGNLIYECYAGSYVTLDDTRFNSYWRDELRGSGNLNYIRFDSLPSSSQGTLYYRYRSASNTGSMVQTGTNYYYGTYTPRLDYISFVPNEDFAGTVYIPFTGWSNNNDRFSGTIEIDVTGAGGSGSVWYTCRPGRTVDFSVSDFNRLSSSLTGRDVDFIKFQDLPNSSTQGSLYYNSSRVTSTSRNYYRSGGTYQIRNLSFRAASSFSGSVNIPFTGRSANGINFDGTLTISSDGSGNWSSSIYYSTDYNGAAVFDRDDFDELSQLETDRNVSSVRFTIPGTNQGSLYRNYYSSSSRGTRITTSTYSASGSELNRIAFVPASGFTGTVLIDFTATAASGGGTFTGTVEVEVGRPSADVTARYSTRTAPVTFSSTDLRRSNYTLSSIQFTSLPASSEGHLYYRYTTPTQYERQVSTGTSYTSSEIANLTFVPRAGFTGTVYLAYTGTNSNRTTFEGEVAITVSPTYTSTHFNDMGAYSNEARAAVEYLYDLNVTRGISSNQYGPKLNISRGDFAVMVYTAFGFTPSGSYQIFSDVPTSARYAQAVNTLYNRGIVSGVGSGIYGPTANISRQDAICIVQRAMRAVGWSTNGGTTALLNSYSDGGSVSGYARNDMANAIWNGYLPTVNGRLDSASPLTRVDMAQILHRVLTY